MWKKVVVPLSWFWLLWVPITGTTTYTIYNSLSRANATIWAENVPSIRAGGLMQESLWRLQLASLDAVESDDGAVSPEIGEFEAQFERSLVAAEQAANNPGEQVLVKIIRERFSAYRDFIHRNRKVQSGDPAALAAVREKSARMAQSIAEPCTSLVTMNERLMTETVARGARLEVTLHSVRLTFMITGPILGICIGLVIARNLKSSISRIGVTLQDASGELGHEVGCVEITPSRDPDDLPGLSSQVHAIAARIRQVVTKLQAARREAVLSERLAVVGELAAGVAHELRNPLTSVKLLVQTAPRSNLGVHLQEKQVRVILQEISRMEDTIQGLLDFARPPELNRVRHDLCETLRRALNLVAGRAAHEGVAVELRLPDAPVWVNGDPEQLHQVFVNLLINGIESMKQAGSLEISTELPEHTVKICKIIFADSGCGIPEERLNRIFEPFVTTKERGTGLGLAISRRIVHEHGGLITASNRRPGGAVFTVEVPLAESAIAVPHRPRLDPAVAPACTGGPRQGAPGDRRAAAPCGQQG